MLTLIFQETHFLLISSIQYINLFLSPSHEPHEDLVSGPEDYAFSKIIWCKIINELVKLLSQLISHQTLSHLSVILSQAQGTLDVILDPPKEHKSVLLFCLTCSPQLR